jgi:hypothetical protein
MFDTMAQFQVLFRQFAEGVEGLVVREITDGVNGTADAVRGGRTDPGCHFRLARNLNASFSALPAVRLKHKRRLGAERTIRIDLRPSDSQVSTSEPGSYPQPDQMIQEPDRNVLTYPESETFSCMVFLKEFETSEVIEVSDGGHTPFVAFGDSAVQLLERFPFGWHAAMLEEVHSRVLG